MKLKRLILPAILAVSAAAGLAFAKAQPVRAARAMADYENDADIDVGINLHTNNTAKDDWGISQFYINNFLTQDVSGGDYLAFRMKVGPDTQHDGGDWFDIVVNVDDSARSVKQATTGHGLKYIPYGPAGVGFDHAGIRAQFCAINFWANDVDGYFCIPKSSFSTMYFENNARENIDWTKNIWAVYFFFYGVSNNIVDVDIGDIFTANVVDNRLVKVQTIFSWANQTGTSCMTDTGNMSRMNVTRNNENLCPAARFVHAIENVDSCNATAAGAAYDAQIANYSALNAANLEYLDDVIIGDYVDGDETHEGLRTAYWTGAQKWAAIVKASGHGAPSNIVIARREDMVLPIVIASVSTLLAAGLFFMIRRRKTNK